MKEQIIAMGLGVLMSVATGCTAKSDSGSSAAAEDDGGNKTLVLYYSQTGATKTVAEELQRQLGDADIAAIEVAEPYPADYDATIKRWRAEVDSGIIPALKPLTVDLDDYKTIFLGFPIWGGTYALPISTFVKDHDLSGKKVVTFATFGSGGIGSATLDLAQALPEADVYKGYGVRNCRLDKAPAEITRFLKHGGYIKGEVERLPAYSVQEQVTDAERAIFDAACSDYKFPLGEPQTVGRRTTPAGTDYKFKALSTTPDGKEGVITIYVTVNNGEAPEFTLVER